MAQAADVDGAARVSDGTLRKHWTPLACITLLVATLLSAVEPGSGEAADVIKFGIATPLSGPAAPWAFLSRRPSHEPATPHILN